MGLNLSPADARVTSASLAHLMSLDMGDDELADMAFVAWGLEVQDRIDLGQQGDLTAFESAWHCVKAAAAGERVFQGLHRVCKPNLEGLPVGLICSPDDLIKLVHHLYLSMAFEAPGSWRSAARVFPSWKVQLGSRTVDFLSAGNPVSEILLRQHSTRACLTAHMAMAIDEWTRSYRRLH